MAVEQGSLVVPQALTPNSAEHATTSTAGVNSEAGETSHGAALSTTTAPGPGVHGPGHISTTISAAEGAWINLVNRLEPWERRLFLRFSVKDLQSYHSKLQSDAALQNSKSKSIKCARVLSPVVRALEVYSPLVTSALSNSPVPATSILGAIQCFLLVPNNLLDMHDKIIQDLDFLGQQARILLEYQHRLFSNNIELQNILYDVFTSIFDYFRKITALFYDKQGQLRTTKMMGKSLISNYSTEIGVIKSTITRHLDHFTSMAKLFTDLRTNQFQQRMEEDQQQQHNKLDAIHGMMVRLTSSSTAQANSHAYLLPEMDFYQPARSQGARDMVPTKSSLHRLNNETREHILTTWLPCVEFDREYNQNSSKLKNTCQWIFQADAFLKWRYGDSPDSILTVQGSAGCGKSFLAASVFQNLSSDATDEDTAIVQIYCKAMERTQASAIYLFGSILKQLLLQDRNRVLDGALGELYRKSAKNPPSAQELLDLVVKATAVFRKTFVVIDGIDECGRVGPTGFGDFCDKLHSFAMSTSDSVRLLCFARPNYELFDRKFASHSRVDVDRGENEPDMKLFIQTMLFEQEPIFEKKQDLKIRVEEKLLYKAKGVFLWLRCQIPSLRPCSFEAQIMEEIDDLPDDMTDFYTEQVTKILSGKKKSRKDYALKILIWTCNAHRNISQQEMAELLAVQPSRNELIEVGLIEGHGPMTSECHDLVMMQDGFYQPMHKSLEDWIHQLVKEPVAGLEYLQELQATAHYDIAVTCLTYLQFDKFSKKLHENEVQLFEFLEQHPFYRYAAAYWGDHVQQVGEYRRSQLTGLIHDFLSSEDHRDLSMQVLVHEGFWFNDGWSHPKSTTLHLCSVFNLVDEIKNWPNVAELINQTDSYTAKPMDYALEAQNKEISLWILEKAVELNLDLNQLTSVLQLQYHVARNNWPDIIRFLHEHKVNFDAQSFYKQTALHAASRNGAEEALSALLDIKVNLELEDCDGDTPLLVAADLNNSRMVGQLLDAGANVHRTGPQGFTPLHMTSYHGDTVNARKLLAKSADPHVQSDASSGHRLPLHVAVDEDQLEIIKVLIPVTNVNQQFGDEWTALMLAARHGNNEGVKLLLRAGAIPDLINSEGITALHIAAAEGFTEIATTLYHASPDILEIADGLGATALVYAIDCGHSETALSLLTHGASVQPKYRRNRRPLHLAIETGLDEVVAAVLDGSPEEAKTPGLDGDTTLHVVAEFGRADMIEDLIMKYGVDLNATNSFKATAVHVAAVRDQVEILRELLRVSKLAGTSQAVDFTAYDEQNRTALHTAAGAGALDCVEFLIQQGVESNVDRSSNLPYHLAAHNGSLDCVMALLPENVDIQGHRGQSALFMAAINGHQSLIDHLLSLGADVNARNQYNVTSLHAAIDMGHTDLAKFLLNKGADPHAAMCGADFGRTPLHCSAEVGNVEISKLLLAKGCSVLSRDRTGRTPLQLAIRYQNVDFVKLFLAGHQNGLSSRDDVGKTCFHHVAVNGNMEMLDFLLGIEDKPMDFDVHTTDDYGNSTLFYAASRGHIAMVERLHELGVDVNGGPDAAESPMHVAASDSDFYTLVTLQDLGANIDATSDSGTTALMIAIEQRCPRTAGLLLCEGADPLKEDSMGRNAWDYMNDCVEFWARSGVVPGNLPTPSRIGKQRRAYQGIIDALETLGQFSDLENLRSIHSRSQKLGMIATALLRLSATDQQLLSDGLTILTELGNHPGAELYSLSWTCVNCRENIDFAVKWVCTVCPFEMCNSCHESFVVELDDDHVRIPWYRKEWELLEKEIQPVRALCALFKCDIKFIARAFSQIRSVESWVDSTHAAYVAWADKITYWQERQRMPLPGLDFLNIVMEAWMVCLEDPSLREVGTKDPETTMVLEKLERNLGEHFQRYPPHRVVTALPCEGHRYVQIPNLNQDPDDLRIRLSNSACKVSDEKLEQIKHTISDRIAKLTAEEISITEPSHTELSESETIILVPGDRQGTASSPEDVVLTTHGYELETTRHEEQLAESTVGTQSMSQPNDNSVAHHGADAIVNGSDPDATVSKVNSSQDNQEEDFSTTLIEIFKADAEGRHSSELNVSLNSWLDRFKTRGLRRGKGELDRVTPAAVKGMMVTRRSLRREFHAKCVKVVNEGLDDSDPESVARLLESAMTELGPNAQFTFDIFQQINLGALLVDLVQPGESFSSLVSD